MRCLVLGAGAVGSTLGAFLSAAGHAVHLVGRGEHVRAVREQGLRVSGLLGDVQAQPEAFVDLRAALTGFAPDWILLTVKGPDTQAALAELAAAEAELAATDAELAATDAGRAEAQAKGESSSRAEHAKPASILHLQNGIGNYELIRTAFPEREIVSGMVIIGFRIVAPGHADVTVYGGDMQLGPRPGPDGCIPAGLTERTRHFARELMTASGIGIELSDRIDSWLWAKLLYNAALNPLGALLGVEYGVLENPETVAVMRDLLHEAFAVAQAAGVDLFWKDAQEYLAHLRGVQIPATQSHRPSMLADLERGRRTEIDFLNGAIVRLAERQGLAAPVNATLARLIRFQEDRSFRGEESPRDSS